MNKRVVIVKNYPLNMQEDVSILSSRFNSIKQRCYNINCKHYKDYGGRGIKVCPECLEHKSLFIKWALSNGFSKELHIDREENDEDYEPSNCRFITLAENNRNQRRPKASPEFTYDVLYGKYSHMSTRDIAKISEYRSSTVHRIRHRDCSKELETYYKQKENEPDI